MEQQRLCLERFRGCPILETMGRHGSEPDSEDAQWGLHLKRTRSNAPSPGHILEPWIVSVALACDRSFASSTLLYVGRCHHVFAVKAKRTENSNSVLQNNV